MAREKAGSKKAERKKLKLYNIEHVDPKRLKPHPRNYRRHPDDQLAHIERSIRDNGVYRNVLAAKDYTILAGHGVVEAAAQMDLKTVPVRRLDVDPLDPRALKVLAGDNEIGNLADVDDRMLAEIMWEVRDGDELEGSGIGEAELDKLLASIAPPDPPDEFPEVGDDVKTQYGCPKCGYEWSGNPKPGSDDG